MPGSQVCHYLSDATGSINVVGGDLLWRATKEPADVFWQPEHVVCGEMEQFIITYAPTVDLLEMVQVDMTVRAAARPGPYKSMAGVYAVTGVGTTRTGRRQEVLAIMRALPEISAVFDYAVFSDHNLRIGGNSYQVIGDVTASGKITNAGNVTGSVEQYAPSVAMPEIDLDRFAAEADQTFVGDVTFNGVDFNIGTEEDPQIIFVDGVVTMSGNISGVGMIVSTEGFNVTGTVQYADEGSALAMLTTRNFELAGTADVVGLIYAHNVTSSAEFEGIGTPTVHGAVVADVVTINGTLEVTWDPRLKNIKGLPGSEGQVDVISWEQL